MQVNMPSAAYSYSKNYAAVDHNDRLCSKKVYGNLGHGSNKVWKHLLWHMVNLACGNAWIIFQKCSKCQNPKSYDHLSFRHELATQLKGGYSSRKKITHLKCNFNAHVIDNLGTHEYVRMNSKRPKCCVLHKHYQPNAKTCRETIFGCYQCNSHLCRECFITSHTNPSNT